MISFNDVSFVVVVLLGAWAIQIIILYLVSWFSKIIKLALFGLSLLFAIQMVIFCLKVETLDNIVLDVLRKSSIVYVIDISPNMLSFEFVTSIYNLCSNYISLKR